MLAAFALTLPATAETSIQDKLRAENIEKFKEWKESIPDLEKRQYDRIKAVNKRVIRVQNLVIGIGVLILIVNVVCTVFIVRAIRSSGGLSVGTSGGASVSSAREVIKGNADKAKRATSKFVSSLADRIIIPPDENDDPERRL